MLIVICDDKTAQYEKETDSNESFLEKMRIEKVVYNIAVRPKNHHGENETQGCQCIYHIDAIKVEHNYLSKGTIFITKLRNSIMPDSAKSEIIYKFALWQINIQTVYSLLK